MFLEHQHFDLSDKPVLHRFKFKTPLRLPVTMDSEACFIFAVDGKANIHARIETKEVTKDYAVLIKCGRYINKWKEQEDSRTSEAVIIRFYPEIMKKIYRDILPKNLINKKPSSFSDVEQIKVDKMIKNYIDSLLFYFDSPSLMNEELIVLKLKELIALLLNSNRSEEISSILENIFDIEKYSLKEVVDAHLYEDLKLKDLASLTNLSESTFKRKFTERFNESPWKYIKRKRLEKASELLRNTTLTIAEITYECGFSDPGYFSKVFKEFYQSTPKEYRIVTE